MRRILALAVLLSQTVLGSHYQHAPLHHRQAPTLPPCRLNYTTDVWTGCEDVLYQFHITLDDFIANNPGLKEECDGFVPGNTYCIVRQDNTPKNITTDGNCGKQINYKASCVGSTFGDCCNAVGK